ncbi:MAG: outer membrane lipoprotein-sorting protein [Calditrichia bacterium]|nr:outer membrane lipoprotein-sorting protein [Calditrichia bacterium]
MKIIIAILIMLPMIPVWAQMPSGDEILDKIDQNMSSDSRVFTSKMIIHGRRGSRTVESKSWAVGDVKSFTEYLAPAREKDTKMLKLEDQLWMYSPSTDRTIQISGHMLRQSVMGSDLSYEDMMDDKKMQDHYDAVVVGTDTIDNRLCWLIELLANTKDIAYEMRKIWVDQKRFIPLRQELYAKSGKLLKRMELSDVVEIENRWYPKHMLFKDMLKEGEGTEFIIEDIEFDVDIPDYRFSKAALRR